MWSICISVLELPVPVLPAVSVSILCCFSCFQSFIHFIHMQPDGETFPSAAAPPLSGLWDRDSILHGRFSFQENCLTSPVVITQFKFLYLSYTTGVYESQGHEDNSFLGFHSFDAPAVGKSSQQWCYYAHKIHWYTICNIYIYIVTILHRKNNQDKYHILRLSWRNIEVWFFFVQLQWFWCQSLGCWTVSVSDQTRTVKGSLYI